MTSRHRREMAGYDIAIGLIVLLAAIAIVSIVWRLPWTL